MPLLDSLPPDLYAEAIEVIRLNPILQDRIEYAQDSCWANFRPRPDKPEDFDQQASFCFNKDVISFFVGGNASGTTEAAAFKAARFLLYDQPPPRKDTPFWIASNTYEQTMDVCWKEKMVEHGHIPACEVDWPRVSWHDSKQGHPRTVPLLPWPEDRGGDPKKNWKIEFKSFDQQRSALQAKSIGGFWFSEQFPLDRFLETLRGCREYMFSGGMFAEFTPVDPELCLWVEDAMEAMPEGWAFYRANTQCNRPNLADGWFESFFAAVPEEMIDTRMTGALATFEGVIYSAFLPAVHVVDEIRPADIPRGVFHYRGVDWGASEEHPFTTVFGYRDGVGDWFIYDEYWNNSQSKITLDHVVEIVERSQYWGWPGKWQESNNGPVFASQQSPHYCETYADPSRPGELNEFNLRGIPSAPAGNDIYKGIDCIRSLLKSRPNGKPKLLISRKCKHLIEEMRKYRWKKGRKPTEGMILNPQVAQPIPLKRDDDTADALRYMIYSAERGRGAAPGSMSHREYAKKRRAVQIKPGQTAGRNNNVGSRRSSGLFAAR